ASSAAFLADDANGQVFLAYTQGPEVDRRHKTAKTVHIADLPTQARDVLKLIKAGGPFPYAKDGTIFGNREGRLPPRQRGYYKEYTVKTPGVRDRGPRRIVAGAAGEYYYTDDHYRTFALIKE
ncbi:MAG: ribonuclease domain-containing protein, partial [Pseudomonadota bacterium]